MPRLILDLDPGSEEAQDALIDVYESAGKWNDLISVLTKKAETTTEPAHQVALYMRIAELEGEGGNKNLNKIPAT